SGGAEPTPTALAGTPPPPPPPRTLVGAAGSGPRPPWWRRPRSLVLAGILVAVAVVVAVLLVERQPKKSNAAGSSSTGTAAPRVTLQAASANGQDPYTGSVTVSASAGAATGASASASGTAPAGSGGTGTGSVSGATVGLYGGTERNTSCDVDQLADFLTSHPDKGRAWAGVEGIDISRIPAYLHSLTSVVLRVDTRVTNHGFANGAATSFQSVLQAGSAVLVDDHGVPRARCACGNPLLPPIVDTAAPQYTGDSWPAFRADSVVTVQPAPAPVSSLTLVDPQSGQWFTRPVGGDGSTDRGTSPPSSSPSSGTATSAGTGASGSAGAGPSGSASASPSASHSASPSPSASVSAGSSSSHPSSAPPTGPASPLSPLSPLSS
ncbi:DUF6777 domain-containing protein, partial [Kitasatospora sp. LaBMicrA B282]|uniref:DUF6777 domain-containing protein n=1 Tax=Kitasatospora sp. LaBMicrA B282 TaxID=3420949 RepID=UPI003D11A08C